MPRRTEAQKLIDQTPHGKFLNKISKWKTIGLICETVEEIEGIYGLYISSERCEECNCPYTKENKKCMDHCHESGKFRYILCNSCNLKQRMDNTSGMPNIHKYKCGWKYQITIKGKRHTKSSKDLEWLKQYKLEYEKNNLYIY